MEEQLAVVGWCDKAAVVCWELPDSPTTKITTQIPFLIAEPGILRFVVNWWALIRTNLLFSTSLTHLSKSFQWPRFK